MIYVTGDPQRPLVCQDKNIRVFEKLVRASEGKSVMKITTSERLSMDEWKKTQTKDGKTFIEDVLLTDGLVVWGYEMPVAMMKYLDSEGFCYVNVVIHPARFASDLVFGYKSNTRKHLCNFVSRDELQLHADVYSEWVKKNTPDPPPTPSKHMVIGQSRFDRSVLWDGEFHKVEEFVPNMDMKFLRRHPDEMALYQPEPWEMVSVYRLLVNGGIRTVEGMNSSVLYEAPFFGVESVIHGPKWWEEYTPVWGYELFGMAPTPPNFFRRLFGVWWGYENKI